MIVIVDYGLGNLKSIHNILKKIGAESIISSDRADIEKADRLILPGVGAYDNAINNIRALDLLEILNRKVIVEKTPVLGICLGMQLMTSGSEEGAESGFGWIAAKTVRFGQMVNGVKLRVPHMGWNNINMSKGEMLFNEMDQEEIRFYFVHSYYVQCFNQSDIISSTHYGVDFTSSFRKDNIVGTQFHPEKSHRFGMTLLKNFIKYI
jgi:glutamine amidotransferase